MVGREGWLVVAEEEEMATEKARGYSGGHWKKEKRGEFWKGLRKFTTALHSPPYFSSSL